MTFVDGFERPNLPIGSAWKSTLNLAFQTLRRIKFVVAETFSFGDFDPQINWNGMAVSAVNIRRAKYLKIYKLLFFSVDFTGVVAAPLNNSVIVTLPATVAGNSGDAQSAGCSGNDAGAAVALVWQASALTTNLYVYRYNFVNYTAGVFRGIFNGFVEVI